MTPADNLTIAPNLPRLFRVALVNCLMLLVAIAGVAFGLFGFGNWTVVACVAAIALHVFFLVAAVLRRRPRLVVAPEEFVFEGLFRCRSHSWNDIEGWFTVVRIGWNEAVAFNLTPEYKSRIRKEFTSSFGGYNAGFSGLALPRRAGELAAVLNEHLQRFRSAREAMAPNAVSAEPGAAAAGGDG